MEKDGGCIAPKHFLKSIKLACIAILAEGLSNTHAQNQMGA